jgi:hypothetical protein
MAYLGERVVILTNFDKACFFVFVYLNDPMMLHRKLHLQRG